MRLSELRPCDNCQKPLGPHFVVLRHSQALVDAKAAREVLGTAAILCGSLRLAEAMAPMAEAVLVFGDQVKVLEEEFLLCNDCGFGDLSIGSLLELARERRERALVRPPEASVGESV